MSKTQSGFALITVMLLMTVLLALVGAYATIARIEFASAKLSSNSAEGFYAAEAGLNMRAEEVRQIFLGYNLPKGTAPIEEDACVGFNQGDEDLACNTFTLGTREVTSYLEEDANNPYILTIPPGERYQNLNAQEYRYTVVSRAVGPRDNVEAILELQFKSRLVPLFQFAAFYNKDLEILPGPVMELEGPVHVNGDLYLNANNRLDIDGQVTTSGALWRGRKNNSTCKQKPVRVKDPISWESIHESCPGRTEVTAEDLLAWNGMIQRDVTTVDVPAPEVLDPETGQIYWDKADLRLVLSLDGAEAPDTTHGSTGVEVHTPGGTVDIDATNKLHACTGSISTKVVGSSNSFYSNREGGAIHLLEVDMIALLNCVHTVYEAAAGGELLGPSKTLDDDSEGGLVFFFTVKGPSSLLAQSMYGVRIRNAAELQSTEGGAPPVQGLTVVSDQALFSHGDYNSTNKIPAAFLCDAFNVLSNNWNLNDTSDQLHVDSRVASNTVINAAVLSGTDTTGGVEGAGGQGGSYNGGLENYPRFHERWSGKTLTYYGSFVSLNTSRHSSGAWVYGNPQYKAPNRDWHYDTDFNDAANLPPLTPRFVYLRQELFLRDFEQ